MTVAIDQLNKLTDKESLIGWLVENFTVSQLQNCLNAFEGGFEMTEMRETLPKKGKYVDITDVAGLTSSVAPSSVPVGEACNPMGDLGGFQECVSAMIGNKEWKLNFNGSVYTLTTPAGKKWTTDEFGSEFHNEKGQKAKEDSKTHSTLKDAFRNLIMAARNRSESIEDSEFESELELQQEVARKEAESPEETGSVGGWSVGGWSTLGGSIGSSSKYKADFGSTLRKLQAFGARRNRYVTSAKRTPSGYKFLTYDFKNGKWNKNGTWKTARSVMSGKPYNGKPTKAGLTNFFGLKDLVVDQRKVSNFGKSKVIPLKPMHPMSFGYAQKFDRTYGQLFPLGKYAYVNGLHKGVSSTFSEAFAKRHGLYPPPRTRVKNRWTYNQSQFGLAPANYNYTGSMDPGMFNSNNDLQLEATNYSFGKTRKPTRKSKTVKRKSTRKPTTTKRKTTRKPKTVKPKSKTVKRKTVKRKSKTVKPKSKTVKRKTTKTVPKVVKNQAKRHGIKLTVLRAGKRVPKSEKVLKTQIKNAAKKKT